VTTQKSLEKIPSGISATTHETCYSCVVTDIPDGMFSRLFCVVTDIPDGIFSRLF
jgi:hypothetical protein